jgi:hypothetical protein
VATRTGTHQRRVSTMRWFGGGEMTAFGHRRRWPDAQRWLATAYRTGGRMRMRRRGGQFTKRSSRGWSSPRSAMAAASFVKCGAEAAAF